MKRVADSQLTKDSEDGDGSPDIVNRHYMPCYPDAHPRLTFLPQEAGTGFKRASDTELAARRCARSFPTKRNSQLSTANPFQSESVAQTCITCWECGSSTRQFRTIGAYARQTRPRIMFLTFHSLLQNPSLLGSLVSDPPQPTQTRSPSARPPTPQQMLRTSKRRHPPSHPTFHLRRRHRLLLQAPPRPKSSPHSSIRALMVSQSILYQLRLLKHVRRRTTMPRSPSTRAFAV